MKYKCLSLLPGVLLMLLTACEKPQKQWQFQNKIMLPTESKPLALARDGESLWFSDPDYYRLYKIDLNGKLLDSITGIQRPMNIHQDEETIYIPEFLTDTIWQYDQGVLSPLKIKQIPQAPAGISVYGDTVLIADFYNHRIIVETPDKSFTIGKQGDKEGELYYPIDVKLYNNKIFVADAYNHRVQVFDFNGKYEMVIGQDDNINVASGISLSESELAVTDQEGGRVLVYAHNGQLMQILEEGIRYPTDVLIEQKTLFISNFKENAISVYHLE